MIRPIDIRLNAAHPELPLVEATTFTGSPSTVLIRGVPPNCGRWAITAVFAAASFPDGSTTARAAVQSANGVWVATLPATATSGRTANGLRVMADGIDENGETVTGYILGVADFAVASLDVTPAPQPGETSYQMLYFDAVPSVLRKGDVAKIDGVLKFYNGTAWEPFAAPVTLDDTVTPSSANGVKSSGIWSAIWGALSALPTGFSSLYGWCMAQIAKLRDKLDLNVYDYGESYVAFPAGYSITYMDDTYSTPADVSIGITFYGPISSTAVPQYNFWVPYEYKDATDFDPQAQKVWCLYGNNGNSAPYALMYGTGASYTIHDWNTKAPTLTLSNGEASGGEPTMTRPISATGDTLAKASQLAGKLDKSGGTVTGKLDFGSESEDSLRLGLVYDVENHRLQIVDNWNANTAYFEVPSAADGSRVAFTSDVNNAIAAIPYSLGTPTAIDTASSETVEGEAVYYGAATLADRTANIVQVTAATPLDELRITFPAATSGKVRDFGLRVEIGTGSAALAAPALVPLAPTGETIKIENADGTIPALADGTATAKGVTLLYFSETAPGVFVVKGEQVEEVA